MVEIAKAYIIIDNAYNEAYMNMDDDKFVNSFKRLLKSYQSSFGTIEGLVDYPIYRKKYIEMEKESARTYQRAEKSHDDIIADCKEDYIHEMYSNLITSIQTASNNRKERFEMFARYMKKYNDIPDSRILAIFIDFGNVHMILNLVEDIKDVYTLIGIKYDITRALIFQDEGDSDLVLYSDEYVNKNERIKNIITQLNLNDSRISFSEEDIKLIVKSFNFDNFEINIIDTVSNSESCSDFSMIETNKYIGTIRKMYAFITKLYSRYE